MRSERVAILAAMVLEMRPLLRALPLRRHDLSGVTSYLGSHHGRDIVAAVTGIGTASARRATEVLLDAHDIDRVLMVGIAGAVDPQLGIGSLVMPAVVIDGATGAELRPTATQGHGSGGAILTTDELLNDGSQLEGLTRRGIIAVDMESSAVGAVCRERGVDWSVFRAISDRTTDPRTDEDVLGLARSDGSADLWAVLRYLGCRPDRVVHLARLGRGSHLATRAASAAVVSWLDE